MSTDLLRRAATLLRQRAETPGRRSDPWEVAANHSMPGYVARVEFAGDPQWAGVADTMWPDAAEYIAMLHPPVAFALADLLDDAAGVVESAQALAEQLDVEAHEILTVTDCAVAVARVILREAAPA